MDDLGARARRRPRAPGTPPGRRTCRTISTASACDVIAFECSPNMCPSWPRKSGWSAAMFTSEKFAPQTSAPSSSATRVSSRLRARERDAVAHDRSIGRYAPASSSRRARDRLDRPARRACPGCTSARPPRSSSASSTSIGSATNTGPHGGVAAILIALPQHAQRRGRVDRPRRPLGHRPSPSRRGRRPSARPSSRTGRPTRRRSRRAGRRRASPGTSSRSRCRARRRCAAGRRVGFCVARA